MQFGTIAALAITASTLSVGAAPVERRGAGIQCHKSGNQFYWNYSSNQQDQNYNCDTSSSTLNLLSCVSVLDGSNVSVPITDVLNILNL